MTSSPKGQAEIILELCDTSTEDSTTDLTDEPGRYNRSLNPFESNEEPTTSRSRFSLSEIKFPNVKKLMKNKREKQANGLCLKITTSKMRCSIKVKEEFENDTGKNLWSLCLIPFTYFITLSRPNLFENHSFGTRNIVGLVEKWAILAVTLKSLESPRFNCHYTACQRGWNRTCSCENNRRDKDETGQENRSWNDLHSAKPRHIPWTVDNDANVAKHTRTYVVQLRINECCTKGFMWLLAGIVAKINKLLSV